MNQDEIVEEWSRRVVERLEAHDVHRAMLQLQGSVRLKLASLLDLPASVLTRDASAARLLRRRLAGQSGVFVVGVVALLSQPTRDRLIDVLGDAASDPTIEELEHAVDVVIEECGARLVGLALAAVADEDAPATDKCRSLLRTHPRVSLEALGPVQQDAPATAQPAPTRRPDDGTKARRAERKRDQKRAKQRAAVRQPARYRRSDRAAEIPADAGADLAAGVSEEGGVPAVSLNGRRLVSGAARRDVRLVGRYQDLSRDDPLVGRVVLAPIRFRGEIEGTKDRPCVVVAASGRAHLVVRTCYSEGGVQAADWRSFPIGNLAAAGLSRPTSVSSEERLVRRSRVITTFGSLAEADWNQL